MQRATADSNRDGRGVSASCTPICNVDTSLDSRKETGALIHSLHKLRSAKTHSSSGTAVDIQNVKTMFLSETVGQIRCLHLRNTLKIDLTWKREARPQYLQFHQSHMQPGPPEPVLVLPRMGQALSNLKEHPIADSTFPASLLSHTVRRRSGQACYIIHSVPGIVA